MEGESLKPDAQYWLVRGQAIPLSHHKQDYTDAGIEWKQYESNEIRAEEVGRLVVSQNRDLFRANVTELYQSIPKDLEKISVLDEWYHKDFNLQTNTPLTEEHLHQTYEFNKNLTGLQGMSYEDFAPSVRDQEILTEKQNKEQWKNNRPSSEETWQQLAKLIATKDPKQYHPTLAPNTHWTNWPDSGCL